MAVGERSVSLERPCLPGGWIRGAGRWREPPGYVWGKGMQGPVLLVRLSRLDLS